MGNLIPGAKIIYESPDKGGTVYGRYAGTNDRWVVGYSQNAKDRLKSIKEAKLWEEIRNTAKSNPALQIELDRVIMLYHLSKKEHGQE
jgi:hypothetical protein